MVDPPLPPRWTEEPIAYVWGITPVTRRFGASNIGFENQAEAERD
jgi:hypothetical protein